MHQPKLVLADGPTGNLDSASAQSLLQLFRQLHEERKSTFLMVTHDPLSASYCERTGYMPATARAILNGCEFIVMLFSLFFILYFHNALLRRRRKEFGLFLLLGMTPAQVGRLVFIESLWLGLMALVMGGQSAAIP